jgi:putative lipoprotein
MVHRNDGADFMIHVDRFLRPFAGLVAVFWTLASAACTTGEESGDGAVEAEGDVAVADVSGASVVRGFLVLGPEVRSIKPCGEDRELWVIPTVDLNEAYSSLSREPYDPVYVEVEAIVGEAPESGFGTDYSGLVTVRDVRRAQPAEEGFGCGEDLSSFAFRATGHEPFWSLRVTPTAIVLSTPDLPETLFEAVAPSVLGDGWVYESRATGPETILLRAVFEPGRCTDSMVGAIHGWRARVEIGDDVRAGCAWEGMLAPGR